MTWRGLVTGALLGALLTPCNVYSGLKIGWSFNMSIAALLLGFAFWRGAARVLPLRRWELQESNINQTTASAAASIISGGLVAPIPALALISGENLPLLPLVGWVFTVSFLGIWVAWYLRAGLLADARLTFPAGVTTAETMCGLFSHGREAMYKVTMLIAGTLTGAAVKGWDVALSALPRWSPSWHWQLPAAGAVSAKNLTFAIDPSPLLLGFGAIIGPRAGLSLAFGALLAWGVIAPWGLAAGHMQAGAPSADWFALLIEWLIWPGVSLMVSATLTSLALRLRRFSGAGASPAATSEPGPRWLKPAGLALAMASALLAQHWLFGIHWSMALAALPMAFLLAAVATRVSGETGIPPIGAIGQMSQFSFGVMAPGQVVTNLITANVAGGAAGQSADLLADFKTGQLVGTAPYAQVLAQCLGVLVGSLVGSWAYLTLIHDPATQLISSEWPAPAVATWKVVAETLQAGLEAVPASARWGMLAGTVVGTLLALAERFASTSVRHLLPSATAMGLAFVIPASIALMLCAGSLFAAMLRRWFPHWSARALVAVAAGLVAGESLAGVVAALLDMAIR